ncbi:hypothetical protein CR513_35065, partial [Mucuna pruriens]
MSSLLRTQKNMDSILVIVDRLTKSIHFVLINIKYSLEKLTSSWDSLLPLVEFTFNKSYCSSIGMTPNEAFYGRRCKTLLCWFESGENLVLRHEKSYSDKRRRNLKFKETDHVFLKFTLWIRVGTYLKSRKLSSRFISPYQILKRVDEVAYQITLPPIFVNLHNIFHVSHMQKYVFNCSYVIELDDPLRIEDQRVKQLRVDPSSQKNNNFLVPFLQLRKKEENLRRKHLRNKKGNHEEQNHEITTYYLSLSLDETLSDNVKQEKEGIYIHQQKYTNELFKNFKMEDAKPMSTPMYPFVALTKRRTRDNQTQSVRVQESTSQPMTQLTKTIKHNQLGSRANPSTHNYTYTF